VAIAYKDAGGSWQTPGWWRVGASTATQLVLSDRQPVRSNHGVWYVYAETTNGSGITWRGDINVAVNDTTVGMHKMEDADGAYELQLNCAGR
jgi:uncharacterized membrane protein